jgi:hypothetical protein
VTPRRRPVADIFDEVFRLYRQNFALMVKVFGVFQVPLVLLSLPFWTMQAQWQSPAANSQAELLSMPQLGSLAAATIGFTIAGIVLGTFAFAGIAYVVSRARTGDRPQVGEVFQALRRRADSLLRLVLIAGLLGIVLTMAIGAVALVALVGGPGIGMGVLAGIVAVVILTVPAARLALAIPALVVERTGPVNALRRSWALGAGSTVRIFAILMLAGLVVGVIGALFSPVYIPGLAEGILTGSVLSYTMVGVTSGLAQVLLGPILPTVLTVMYYDYAARERGLESPS